MSIVVAEKKNTLKTQDDLDVVFYKEKTNLIVKWSCGQVFTFPIAKVQKYMNALRDSNCLGMQFPVSSVEVQDESDMYVVFLSRTKFAVTEYHDHDIGKDAEAIWTFSSFFKAIENATPFPKELINE